MPDLPSAYNDLEKYTEDLCSFIDTTLVRQITGGIHVNDALIYNAWDRLPTEWTEWWSRWPDHRLAQQNLIDSIGEDDTSHAHENAYTDGGIIGRPESLGNWLARLKALALTRTQRPGQSVILPEVLQTRMKTKKVTEVSRATKLIHDLCEARGIRHVVDMGSGQGYLSISLAYLFPELQVLAIDGSESQVAGSQAFTDSLGISNRRLTHMVHWIDGSSALADKVQAWSAGERCILVGLHACGNLSEHMIRYFAEISCIDALAVVGCCYNHIVPRSDMCPAGFPISEALRDRNVTLTPTALMTGCQAPNNWPRPDSQVSSVFGRRRLYRAMLEKLFFDHGISAGSGNERPAWGIRKGDMVGFTAFAHRAMDCLHVDAAQRPTDEQLRAYEEEYRGWEGRIAILWTLSVLCGKVVESVIAVDRYHFLEERQVVQEVDVVPVFDAKVSPRNLMIVATKKVQGG
ncbi:RNA small subunit methyltransferase [Cordyceps fumosorosea ARSEF 2679]|uniref:RNA small subunit methyltransferase n=1 Tax=Cordyceps fumosorosea (strain ARSEF 2679) TaxID=1081104 RepID=A0A162K5B9_CORFA|nr:RNA small subunit methyltransferase [Cordyceps fumosorosea ARSEF 2679]OAA53548.1 RNA small subunit methyltransferase [Cordyceps fumosorosea ARSEF 2679]